MYECNWFEKMVIKMEYNEKKSCEQVNFDHVEQAILINPNQNFKGPRHLNSQDLLFYVYLYYML